VCEAVNRLFADETKKLQEQLELEREEHDKIIEEINAKLDAQGSLVESMKKQMAEKEKALAKQEQALAGRDRTISEKEVTIADLLAEINMLKAQLQGR